MNTINTYGPVPLLQRMKVGQDMKISLPAEGEGLENQLKINPEMEFEKILNSGKIENESTSLMDIAATNISQGLENVNTAQHTGKIHADEFAAGRREKIHETMIDLEQAEISLRFLGSVRNRMLEAYQEIMRINV
ncbi:MAG: flagellar hook-basal body complex protein FliE [Deltaproteobacteria bacterium]|nr:flagellar hook-basal body complex protein FliE [Deltaproteobacteria bacterium]